MATIADLAGVSVSTAARALSGQGCAAEETRRLVIEATKDLGYVPRQGAPSTIVFRIRLIERDSVTALHKSKAVRAVSS